MGDFSMGWKKLVHTTNDNNQWRWDTIVAGANGRCTLDFGAVQAGKTTNVTGIAAYFTNETENPIKISNLCFWLANRTTDSGSANGTGSGGLSNNWIFRGSVISGTENTFSVSGGDNLSCSPSNLGGLNLYDQKKNGVFLTEEQKTGSVSIAQRNDIDYSMTIVSDSEQSGMTFMAQDAYVNIAVNQTYRTSLILLDVTTDANANSGNTEGFYYKMTFLYA